MKKVYQVSITNLGSSTLQFCLVPRAGRVDVVMGGDDCASRRVEERTTLSDC